MKSLKRLLGTVLCLLALAACNQQPATSYTITGQVEGLPEGARVQLIPLSHSEEKPVGDTIVTNGKFVFTGVADAADPMAVGLRVKDVYGAWTLMLENGEIHVTGKATLKDNFYDFEDMVITGSPLTDKFYELMSVRNKMDVLYADYHEQHKEAMDRIAELRMANDAEGIKAFQETEAYKAFENAEMAFFNTVDSSYNALIDQNKETFWGPLLMISLYSYLTEEQKPQYDSLSDAAKASRYGKMVKESVDPEGLKVAPIFTIKDESGKAFTLAQLCEGKKYILIDFWASWCAPCRKEIPNLKEIYKQYADKGFQIVSLSMDKKAEDWKKAMEEEQMPWPNFLDTEGISSEYKVRFIPAMYLIDNQGNVVAQDLRGEVLSAKLAELFAAE